jgi:DNA-binding response OmpR family regulator
MNCKARILIVDDEPNVRLVFRTALESIGYQIEEAANGENALEKLGGSHYDLALLDLQMPCLDGMATLRRLRETGIEVPVVIVTAHGRIPDAVEAMKLGAIDFVSKPVTPDGLREIVSEVINRHATTRSTTQDRAPDPIVTPATQFYQNMNHAKLSLNHRVFEEAEVYLKQAIALKPDSAEAHNLMGVLHELRTEHDASYQEYRAALRLDHEYEPSKHNMMRYYERFTFGKSAIPVDTGPA